MARDQSIKRTLYWTSVFTAFGIMSIGLSEFLAPSLGARAFPLSIALAILIEGIFAVALFELWVKGNHLMILFVFVFGAISAIANAPVIFSAIRGQGLSISEFNNARDRAVHDISAAYGQLHSAALGAISLAEDSKAKQNQEESGSGGTCNIVGKGANERFRFRKREAEFFSLKATALNGFADQLSAALAKAQALRLTTTGAAMDEAARSLNDALSTAGAVTADRGLSELAQQFDDRSSSDGMQQEDAITKAKFVCPDPTIRLGSKAIAAQLRSLPHFDQLVALPDMSDVRTTIVELPSRIARGKLSDDDIVAIFIGCLIELFLISVTLVTHPRRLTGQRLSAAPSRVSDISRIDVGSLLGPEPNHTHPAFDLVRLIELYRISVWPFDFVIVAHGSASKNSVGSRDRRFGRRAGGRAGHFSPLASLI
jgi:hypothetical protein